MKSLFTNCWSKPNKVEPVQEYHISSNMKLSTFGKLSPKLGQSVTTNSFKQLHKEHSSSKVSEAFSDTSTDLSSPSTNENKLNDVAIHAGSPSGEMSKITKTTLNVSIHKQFPFKHQWKNPTTQDDDIPKKNINHQNDNNRLAPIKITPNVLAGKKNPGVLEPVDAPINKLPPVTKSFIRKLERENIQREGKSDMMKMEVNILSDLKHSTVQRHRENINDSDINKYDITISPRTKVNSKQQPIDNSDVMSSNLENTHPTNLYNNEEMHLIEAIEREYLL